MSHWRSIKAKRLLSALLSIGWSVKRQDGSHKTLERLGFPDYVFAFHDGDEIGPKMLAKVAKHTGLKPNDL
ncbi:MAG: type II toxin-antitoxin system HicA family toxin [Treponema sp.]|jgi:predicted RNA binding protein YcfA (HicA-like mRNA interferase family)|nr:type II toxin-antitoxin system HicA family toxin [Treponema sp.]